MYILILLNIIWDKVFKNGLSEICGRQFLKISLAPLLNTLSYFFRDGDRTGFFPHGRQWILHFPFFMVFTRLEPYVSFLNKILHWKKLHNASKKLLQLYSVFHVLWLLHRQKTTFCKRDEIVVKSRIISWEAAALCEKWPNAEFFLVCISLYSDWIRRFMK